MRICIVGAGVAGIQAADVLSHAGHTCHVFDKAATVGGVWRRNYVGFGLQVPAYLYEFPVFPVRDGLPHARANDFLRGEEVMDYIHSFVDHRALYSRCMWFLGTEIKRVVRGPEGGWLVHTAADEFLYDFVVIATGMYGTPHVPEEFPTAVHSSQFDNVELVRGKTVAVVGAGKSALDCALAASAVASHVRLVTRGMHWPVPRRLLGVVPFEWAAYSRLAHFCLPVHWTVGGALRRWHERLAGAKRAVWALLERLILWQFGLAREAMKHDLVTDLFEGGQIMTPDVFRKIRDGTIAVEDSVGAADVVVCATGFEKRYDLFEEDVRSQLDMADGDGLWLYRNVIPPDVPRLAFVGSEVATFNNILTHWLQAHWLVHFLDAEELTPETMREGVAREKEWKRSFLPFSTKRAATLQLHMTQYHDALLDDLGCPKPRMRWWEWALPLCARDYFQLARTPSRVSVA